MSRFNFFGEFTFEMEPHMVSALELWFNQNECESEIEQMSNNTCLLEIKESDTKAVDFMYYVGTFLNKHAKNIIGNVECTDDTETEKDEYLVEDGVIRERAYFYDGRNKCPLTKDELIKMIIKEDRIANTDHWNLESNYGDRIFNVCGFKDKVPEVVNGLIEDVNNAKEDSYFSIYIENGRIVLNPYKIFFLPFVPEKTKKLQKARFGLDWMKDFSDIPFEKIDAPHINMKFKNLYLPFTIDFMCPDVEIKDNNGNWVHSCDVCVNRFDAALNNGICKKGCNPSLLNNFELGIPI